MRGEEMPFKTELHAHTKETSNCGEVPAAELIEAYINAGYSTVVITDHLSTHTYFRYDYGNMSWDEKIDVFVKGYKAAKDAARGRINVLFGMELRFDMDNVDNDYLVFGIDENFLRNNGDLINMNIKSFSKLAHENGLIIFQAHPFRVNMRITDPKLLDGIEVYNACIRHNSNNEIAEAWADKYGLMKSSGSDYHRPEDVGKGGIITETPITDNTELIKTLLSGDYNLIKE
jgi:predicted metal-dependent phosphoesterase TrpH